MKQVLQYARSGEIAVEEVPAPQLLPGCALVRIAASVVSAGTERASSEFARKSLLQKAKSRPDLVREVISKVQRDGIFSAVQAVRSRLDQPQSPGYSSAGTVIAVGEGITDVHPGDRVACAGAGFAVHAEIACVPRLLLARIPARDPIDAGQVAFDEAAFATLGAVALHGIRTARSQTGRSRRSDRSRAPGATHGAIAESRRMPTCWEWTSTRRGPHLAHRNGRRCCSEHRVRLSRSLP